MSQQTPRPGQTAPPPPRWTPLRLSCVLQNNINKETHHSRGLSVIIHNHLSAAGSHFNNIFYPRTETLTMSPRAGLIMICCVASSVLGYLLTCLSDVAIPACFMVNTGSPLGCSNLSDNFRKLFLTRIWSIKVQSQ